MPEKTLDSQAVADVYHCLDALAGHLEIEYMVKPPIRASNEIRSSYDARERVIYVAPDAVGSGIAYCEGAGHFLRRVVILCKDEPIEQIVDGFFGRLAEDMGRQLMQGTPYSRLFSAPRRNFSDMGYFEEQAGILIDRFATTIKTAEEAEAAAQNSYIYLKGMGQFTRDLSNTFRFYHNSRDNAMFRWGINAIAKQYQKVMESTGSGNGLTRSITPICSELSSLAQQLIETGKTITRLISSAEMAAGKKKKRLGQRISYRFRKAVKYLETMDGNITEGRNSLDMEDEPCEARLHAMNAIMSFRDHFTGYIAAERFIAGNPDFMEKAKVLFRQYDSEVFAAHFRMEIPDHHIIKYEQMIDEKIGPWIKEQIVL